MRAVWKYQEMTASGVNGRWSKREPVAGRWNSQTGGCELFSLTMLRALLRAASGKVTAARSPRYLAPPDTAPRYLGAILPRLLLSSLAAAFLSSGPWKQRSGIQEMRFLAKPIGSGSRLNAFHESTQHLKPRNLSRPCRTIKKKNRRLHVYFLPLSDCSTSLAEYMSVMDGRPLSNRLLLLAVVEKNICYYAHLAVLSGLLARRSVLRMTCE